MINYTHELPGRLRVRCPVLRKDLKKTTAIRNSLESTCGVKSVAINPMTGSFTVHYDQDRTSGAQLLRILEQHGCHRQSVPAAEPIYTRRGIPVATVSGRALSAHGPEIGKLIAGFVVEKAIERSLLALVAAVL